MPKLKSVDTQSNLQLRIKEAIEKIDREIDNFMKKYGGKSC